MATCCVECFRDNEVRRRITLRGAIAYCDSCGSEGALAVHCADLSPDFTILSSMYETAEEGSRLIDLVQQHWALFSDRISDPSSLLALLFPEAGASHYVPASGGDSYVAEWEALRQELKYANRYFPTSAPPKAKMEELLGLLVVRSDALPRTYYRARIQRGEADFLPAQLGPPPAELAKSGRANPDGIPYLYLSSDRETAIAEVRPSVGDKIAIAKVRPRVGFSIIDLADPRLSVSPLRLDLDYIEGFHRAMDFLSMLSRDLSSPAPPHRTNEYIATQYLCELIKSVGYKGVRYSSSLGRGKNYAMYEVDCFDIDDEVEFVIVSEVNYDFVQSVP